MPAPHAATGAGGRQGVVAVVLAAGEGVRLRPLTSVAPKALCPVGNEPLVDLAIDRLLAAGVPVAVNVHHGRELLEPHLVRRGDVEISVEQAQALGTAGALGHLRPWIDGRAVLVVNADAWAQPDLTELVEGWDGARVRILISGDGPFGPRSSVVASILPWVEVSRFDAVPSGLYESCWRALEGTDGIDTVSHDGPFVDCGTVARYLQANQWAAAQLAPATSEPVSESPRSSPDRSGSLIHPSAHVLPGAVVVGSVIGAGSTIEGHVRDSVVWAGNEVRRSEVLVDAVRASSRVTVLVR